MRYRNLPQIRNEGTRSSRGRRTRTRELASRVIWGSLLVERLEDRTLLSLLPTTTELSASVPAPVYGQAETFTAAVVPTVPGSGTPTGTVTFSDESSVLGTAALSTSGGAATATFTTASLTVGANAITAAYGGDASFASSVSQYGLGFSPVSEVTVPGSSPRGIVTGPDQALWFTEPGFPPEIGRYDPVTQQLTQYTTPTPNAVPQGITVGSDGALWFAETGADQIGRIDPATDQITEYGGLPSGSGVAQIASGPLNSVWFTEPGTNEVGRIDVATGQPTQYAIPTPNSQPSGITEGSDGAVWFAEFGAGQIGRLDPATGQITEYPIPTPESSPVQITTGPDGALWFAESGTNQIGRIDPTTDQITEFPVVTAGPWGIVTGPDGGLWFSGDWGENVVGRLDPATGQTTEFPVPNAAPAEGISVGPDGALWFADTGTNQISRVSLGTTLTVGPASTATAVAASTLTPIAGQPVTFTATVQATAPGAGTPTGTVTFEDGTTPLGTGTLTASGGVSTATLTTALAFGQESVRAVYGGDADFAGSVSQVQTTVAGTFGASGYSGDGGPATAALLNQPTSVAVDAAGDLFIADSYNDVIREVKADGTIVTVGGNGMPGYSGDGGPAVDASLNLMTIGWGNGLAVDAAGDLFIADTNNNVIREVTPDGIITTVAGNGTAGYSGDGGPATSATLALPLAVALDAAGNLFIADSGNDVIREVHPDGTITTAVGIDAGFQYITDVAVDGQGDLFIVDLDLGRVWEVTPGPDGQISDGTLAEVYQGPVAPLDVAVDSSGDLAVSDGNNRVEVVSPDGSLFDGPGALFIAGNTYVEEIGGLLVNVTDFGGIFPTGLAFDGSGALFIADAYDVEEIGGLLVNVQPLTAANLQSSLDSESSDGSFTLQATTNDDLSTALQAIGGLTNANPASPQTVTLDLAGSTATPSAPIDVPGGVQLDLTSSRGTATAQGVTITGGTVFVGSGVTPTDWTVDGGNVTVSGTATAGDFIVNGGTVTLADGTIITGNSPAFTLTGGVLNLDDVTATTATASPTILVTGGALTVRGSTIDESTGYAEAAILMTGGSVDLGTTASPGENVLDVNGPGELVHNTTASLVPDFGNTYEQDGTPLAGTALSFTALSTSAAFIGPGQSVTFTATVSPDDPGTPTGSVDFVDTTTGTDLGTVPLSGSSASLTVSSLAPGTNTITATYSGDSTFAFSVDTLTQTVNPVQTVTTTADSGPGSLRQAIVNVDAETGPGAIDFNITSIPAGSETSYADPGGAPVGIATDPYGNIWFTERTGRTIVRLDPSTDTSTPFSLSASSDDPLFLQEGPDGTLWFTEDGAGGATPRIGEVLTAPSTPPPFATVPAQVTVTLPDGTVDSAGASLTQSLLTGTIIEYGIPSNLPSSPNYVPGTNNESWGLTLAPSPLVSSVESFWFGETPTHILGSISLTGTSVPAGGIALLPDQTVTTPDGTIYSGGQTIPAGTLLPAGTITETLVDAPAFGGVAGLTVGPDGDIWAAVTNGMVFREFLSATTLSSVPADAYILVPGAQPGAAYTSTVSGGSLALGLPSAGYIIQPGSGAVTVPAGSIEVYVSPSNNQPYAVAFDGGGHLWVGERAGTGLAQLSPSTGTFTNVSLAHGGYVIDFVMDSDGNLWFSEFLGQTLGRIDPQGNVVEAYTTSQAGPAGLTIGPDGDLWFTEYLGGQVARLAPTTIMPSSPLPAITNPVTIDGTQPGAPGVPAIALDGSLAGAGASGLTLAAGSGGSVVQGLAHVWGGPT